MYQFVVQLLDPYTLLLVGLVLITVRAWCLQRPRSRELKIGSILLGLLCALSTPVAAHLATRSLTASVLPAAGVPAQGDTIVVLSGGLRIDDDAGERVRLDESSLQRCLHAAHLYKKAGSCRLVLTGGKVDRDEPGPSYAAAMRDFLLEMGVRPGDMVLEERSATTYENALFSRPLLKKEGEGGGRIWLVTDASHMIRAERCFRALEIDVLLAPCDYRNRRWRFEFAGLIPSSHAVVQVSRASHEWLGTAWYRLRGRI